MPTIHDVLQACRGARSDQWTGVPTGVSQFSGIMREIFIRVFVASSESEALVVAERLRQHLVPVAPDVRLSWTRPYWKMPEYIEVRFEVAMPVNSLEQFSSILAALGEGWCIQREGEAIWNPSDDATFAEQSVRWAHVELLE